MKLIYEKLLKKGSRGLDVHKLQSALTDLGYDLKGIDGIFGPITDTVVRSFQKNNNLVVDGLVGPNTIRAINANLIGSGLANPDVPSIYRKEVHFSSDVHILDFDKNYHIDLDLGKRGVLETVSSVVKKKYSLNSNIVAGINAGFFVFNSDREHLGLLIDDGLYYNPPSADFMDMIYYKDGTVDIVNLFKYDKTQLSNLQREAYWAIGTSYTVVQDGKINLQNSEKFDHSKYRNPRTLLGVKDDGSFLFVVVDGRRSTSLGVTAQQSGSIMQYLGAKHAVNLDGGGSSTMVVIENDRVIVKNRPSNAGGSERRVGSMMLAYEKRGVS